MLWENQTTKGIYSVTWPTFAAGYICCSLRMLEVFKMFKVLQGLDRDLLGFSAVVGFALGVLKACWSFVYVYRCCRGV